MSKVTPSTRKEMKSVAESSFTDTRNVTLDEFEILPVSEKHEILEDLQRLWNAAIKGDASSLERLQGCKSRVVGVQATTLTRMWDIDTVTESFVARLWINTVTILPSDAPSVSTGWCTTDELEEAGLGDHYVLASVSNVIEVVDQVDDEGKVYANVQTLDTGVRLLLVGRFVQCKMQAILNLRSYPFDQQRFPVQLRVWGWFPVHHPVIYHELKPASGKNSIMEWDWLEPTFTFDLYDDRKPLVTVSFCLARQFWSPLKNILGMSGLLTLTSLTCFSVPFDDWGSRAGILFTLLLTVVAFKLLLTGLLPKVPYDTFLDAYLGLGIVYLLALIGATAIIPHVGGVDSDRHTLYVFAAIFAAMQLYFGVRGAIMAHRVPEISRRSQAMTSSVREERLLWLQKHRKNLKRQLDR
jgi:hypothetical protein